MEVRSRSRPNSRGTYTATSSRMIRWNGEPELSARTSYRSPLLRIHFLRVIMDKGYAFASTGSHRQLVEAFGKLSVDRRWIVSAR